jgi:predicted aspartyl protease
MNGFPAAGLVYVVIAGSCALNGWAYGQVEASKHEQTQKSLPVLRANSKTIDVQDGDRLRKGIWVADPSVEVDVFCAGRSDKKRTVTFISDIDRLAFEVEPDKMYDFVIVLNDKERCTTRLSTFVRPFKQVDGGEGPVEIPFVMDGGRMIVKASVNGSKELDLIFDTGADTTLIHSSSAVKGVKVDVDGEQSHTGFGGTATSCVAFENTIEVASVKGGIRWEHEPVLWSAGESFGVDGLIGSHVFEDKVVEFDFDRSVLVIHDSLPEKASGFASTAMRGAGRTFAIEMTLAGGEKRGEGWAFFDTGFVPSLMVSRGLDEKLGLRGELRKIGKSRSSGTGKATVESDVLVLPELVIGGTVLTDVPVHVETAGSEQGANHSEAVVGLDVIKRFNMLLDYPKDRLYLHPNSLAGSAYSMKVPSPPWMWIVGAPVGAVMGGVGGVVALRRRKKMRSERVVAV